MRIHISRRYRKPAGLLFVLLLHVVVIGLWRPLSQPARPGVQREIELFLVPPSQVSRAAPQVPVPAAAPAPRREVRRPRAPAVVLIIPPAVQQMPVETTPLPAPVVQTPLEVFDPAPADAAPVPTLQERSRQLAGGIDKQLRKESRNDKDRVLAQEPKLGRDIGGAFRDRSFQMSDSKLGNGDTLTRVRTRFGSYCVRTNGNRPIAGRDPFKDSGKQTMVSCPN